MGKHGICPLSVAPLRQRIVCIPIMVAGKTALLKAAQVAKWEGSVACATGRRSLRRGGGLAGEARGGGWSERGGCPGNALRWLP